MKIKICGLTQIEDIEVANELGLDYVGFVFAKSRRQVSPQRAKELRKHLKSDIQTVGVFVNHDMQEILALLEEDIIQVVQFHGNEQESDIAKLKEMKPESSIIKALSVTCLEDILKWQDTKADYLLLDNGAGGTGEAFDWSLLPELEGFPKPYFIAGGLNSDNVNEVLTYQPYGVDVSGGVEMDGRKDKEKMTRFVKEVRR